MKPKSIGLGVPLEYMLAALRGNSENLTKHVEDRVNKSGRRPRFKIRILDYTLFRCPPPSAQIQGGEVWLRVKYEETS